MAIPLGKQNRIEERVELTNGKMSFRTQRLMTA